MITVSLYPRKRKHVGGWIAPDNRPLAREIADQKFPAVVAIVGPASNSDLLHNFSYGDATPYKIGTVKAGKLIVSVAVDIEQAFNGTGASISIGTLIDPEAVMPLSANYPGEIGTYERTVSTVTTSDTDVYLFIAPGAGASTGNGHVYISVN